MMQGVRYRFSDFILAPRRRLLLRQGSEVPLIPRYFDLLVFLVERRHEAVHRRDIFDRVWSDVIVSDSALSQAIRTIRRALDDDPREPRFIRTVSRHGYRFVAADLIEEPDEADGPPAEARSSPGSAPELPEAMSPWIEALVDPTPDCLGEDARDDAAERLHALGTDEALRQIGTRPHHAEARARLRDARWAVAGTHDVPLLGQPGATRAIVALVRLRLRRASRPVRGRWARASLGSGAAGALAGAFGGTLLVVSPDAAAAPGIVPVLTLVGLMCGGTGGAGVALGMEVAEAVVRSWRLAALTLGGMLGGGVVGALAQWMTRWTLAALLGVHLAVGGALEGLAIGAAAGLGFGLATRGVTDGLAAPRGARRTATVVTTALCCGAAALALALIGRPLVGGTLHAFADLVQGAQTSLAPLGRLIGEPGFGDVTARLIAMGEGAVFGTGLAAGLTWRSRRSTRRAG